YRAGVDGLVCCQRLGAGLLQVVAQSPLGAGPDWSLGGERLQAVGQLAALLRVLIIGSSERETGRQVEDHGRPEQPAPWRVSNDGQHGRGGTRGGGAGDAASGRR